MNNYYALINNIHRAYKKVQVSIKSDEFSEGVVCLQQKIISRRRFLIASFALAGVISTTTFIPFSKNADYLLLCLHEFDLNEGATISDLVYVSEFTIKQVEDALSELIKHSLIYSKTQGGKTTFFLK